MLRLRAGKRVGFRLAAIGLGLVPWLLLELLLRSAGWPPATPRDDPFVGFHSVVPLFEHNAAEQRYEIAAARQGYFRPDSFRAVKGPREFRVFCLGGSTVQGNPWGIETSFTTWLELSLAAADPTRDWQVVNCGGISYASYRLLPILDEVLEYEPDLIILCTGHNEFLEDRSYGALRDASEWRVAMYRALSHVQLYRALNHLAYNARPSARQRTLLPTEVDALLDYRGGLERYHRDDEWRKAVIQHYGDNLVRMVERTRARSVPIILLAPIANLQDCPPFKVELRGQLSSDARARCEQLWQAARDAREPRQRIALLEQLLAIDGRRADAHFLMGQCYAALRWPDEAREHFLRAKDEDVCPLRMLEPMYEIYGSVARRFEVPLVDMRSILEPQCDLGIAGDGILADHVHPTIAGHQLIAARLSSEMQRQKFILPQKGGEVRRKELYRRHLATLGEAYYARGKQHLEGLRLWTQGRAKKTR